jgi:hypothetical protein
VSLILDKLAKSLNSQRPEALLIGGQALPLYGVERQTVDVDCLAAAEGATILQRVLLAAGYTEAGRSETVVRYRHASPMMVDVDVMLVDQQTYDGLRRESQEWRTEETMWRVPSLPHLIALKLHSMKNNPHRFERDLPDIRSLLRENPQVLSRAELEELCAEFGPPGILAELERKAL